MEIIMSIEFREYLMTLRKERTKYNQNDMAKSTGISRSTYIYYETGKSKSGFATLRKNSAIFAVDYKR